MLDRFNQPRGWQTFERIKVQVSRHAGIKRRRHRVRRLDPAGNVVTIEMGSDPVWDDMGDDADAWDVPDDWLWYH